MNYWRRIKVLMNTYHHILFDEGEMLAPAPHPGGERLPYKEDGDARWKFWKEPVRGKHNDAKNRAKMLPFYVGSVKDLISKK